MSESASVQTQEDGGQQVRVGRHEFSAEALEAAGPDDPIRCRHCGLPFYKTRTMPEIDVNDPKKCPKCGAKIDYRTVELSVLENGWLPCCHACGWGTEDA